MSLKFLLGTFEDEEKKPVQVVKAQEFSLAGYLQRERLRLKKTKKPKPASHEFNPSTIVHGYCKRLKVAQLLGLCEIYRELPTPKTELMFDVGNSIHSVIQRYFWNIGSLEGEFHCIKCGKSWWDISPTECSFRKSHKKWHLKYNEVPLKDKDFHISGRADGIVNVVSKKDKERHIIEIKSIGNKQQNTHEKSFTFEDLNLRGPKHEHVVQLTIYMKALLLKKGHIVYVSKNTHQIKTFQVDYNYDIIHPYLYEIGEILELVKDIKKSKADLPPPCERDSCTCESIKAIISPA